MLSSGPNSWTVRRETRSAARSACERVASQNFAPSALVLAFAHARGGGGGTAGPEPPSRHCPPLCLIAPPVSVATHVVAELQLLSTSWSLRNAGTGQMCALTVRHCGSCPPGAEGVVVATNVRLLRLAPHEVAPHAHEVVLDAGELHGSNIATVALCSPRAGLSATDFRTAHRHRPPELYLTVLDDDDDEPSRCHCCGAPPLQDATRAKDCEEITCTDNFVKSVPGII